MKVRHYIIIGVLAIALLAFIGWQMTRNVVYIDRSFIADIQKSPTGQLWETYADELLYLVAKGDEEAVAAAIKILPIAWKSDVVDDRREWLAQEIWDSLESGHEMDAFAGLPVADQVRFFLAYDEIEPEGWQATRDAYLAKRPDVKRPYDIAAAEARKAQEAEEAPKVIEQPKPVAKPPIAPTKTVAPKH